jgi:hypothetical protein
MLINRGTADNGIFMWDESVDKFTLGLTTADGSATGNITLNSLGTLVANIEGAVTGNVTGTVSSLSNHDTDDLAEGSNLYYTQARFDSAFTAKSTSDLSEGTNLYYTDARFDTRLASKDTDDVSEGATNLYYTTARFDSAFSGKSTSDLSEGANLYYTDARAQAVSINNVVEDTTPQLGGNLDLNSSDITGTGNINITGAITASGNITGTLATAAQPNITSVGTLTGFTSTGIDDNATSTAITIDSSQNVGINTSDGKEKLDVSGAAVFTGSHATGTNAYGAAQGVMIHATSSTGFVTAVSNGANDVDLQLRGLNGGNANANQLVLDSQGNVGIGTSTVGTKLNIRSDASDDGILLEKSDGTDIARLFHDGTTTNARFDMFSGGSATVQIKASGDTHFSGGNVGIGCSPSAKLHVANAATEEYIFETTSNNTRSQVEVKSKDSSGNAVQTRIASMGDGVYGMLYTLTNHNLSFSTNNAAPQMTLDTNGQVMIGHASSFAHADADNLAIGDGTNNSGLTIYTGSDKESSIIFGNGGTNGNIEAGIKYYHESHGTVANRRALTFATGGSMQERLRITSSGVVDIKSGGTASAPSLIFEGDTNTGLFHGGDTLGFSTAGQERARLDSSGNLLVGKTSTAFGTAGVRAVFNGQLQATADGNEPLGLNRLSSDGSLIDFYKDTLSVGSIGANGGHIFIAGQGGMGLRLLSTNVVPADGDGNSSDNTKDLGGALARFDDIYATNGTIQTSDRNEKQDIEALTDAETRVAVAAKGLLRKFRWQSAVEEKGEEARIHFGIIAQDLQDAFTAEGLDASDYAMFISTTWWEAEEVIPAVEEELDKDGNVVTEAQEEKIVINTYDSKEEAPEDAIEKTRLGVRYSELLAFIIASI